MIKRMIEWTHQGAMIAFSVINSLARQARPILARLSESLAKRALWPLTRTLDLLPSGWM